jgi:hypothetical protein
MVLIMGLGSHSAIPGVLPPPEYVAKYVVKDLVTGHWFWQETRRNHSHDSKGQAYLSWTVKPTYKTQFVSRGKYNVARLLIEQARGPIKKRARVANTCRLSQCINPDHWRTP